MSGGTDARNDDEGGYDPQFAELQRWRAEAERLQTIGLWSKDVPPLVAMLQQERAEIERLGVRLQQAEADIKVYVREIEELASIAVMLQEAKDAEIEGLGVRLQQAEAEIERLNHEVMRHQVGEGYEAGYEHGTLAVMARLQAAEAALTAMVHATEGAAVVRSHHADYMDARKNAITLLAAAAAAGTATGGESA